MLNALLDGLHVAAGGIRYRMGREHWPAPVFVIGTGRSGTNWVGHVLGRHPLISAAIERPRFFKPSRNMAVNPALREGGLPRLVRLYRFEIARVAPRHFADKSHTNIWIAEALAEAFPDAVFVGVRRGVHATVASMLKHPGVLRWMQDWRNLPLPNAFLGISEGEDAWYESLSPAGRSAVRWVAHENRFTELRPILRGRLIEVRYEQLQLAGGKALTDVQHALGLPSPIPEPEPDRSSLDRWRSELSPQQIAEIDRIVAARLRDST